MPRILMTGAMGFIGKHLTKHLLNNSMDVHVLVREKPASQLSDCPLEENKIHIYNGSMESMRAAYDGARPDLVIHLASLFIAEHKMQDVTPLVTSNVLLGAHLLEAMREGGTGMLITAGTFWKYRDGNGYNPVNLYAATKKAFEDIAAYYVLAEGLRMMTLNLYDTYGPEDKRPKLLTLFNRLKETGDVLRMSPGDQLMGLVHINDVVGAFVGAIREIMKAEKGSSYEYFVTPQEFFSLKEVAAIYSEVNQCQLNIEWGGIPYRKREVMVPYVGPSVPGWRPEIDLKSGLASLKEIG